MTTYSSLHPLRYIAETLSQMAMTLRDFEMGDAAILLDKAKSDIDAKLVEKSKKPEPQNHHAAPGRER